MEPLRDWKEYEAVIQVKNTLKPLKLNRDKDPNWATKQVQRDEIIRTLIYRDLPFKEGDVKNITIYFLAKPSVKITKQLIQSLLDSKSNFLYLGDERIIKDAKYYRSSELVNIGTMFLDCLKYKLILFKN